MLQTPTAARLPDLTLFPTGAVPKSRRAELERVLQERRVTFGRAISAGAVMTLSASFCLFYGVISGFAWSNQGHPAFGVLFSLLSAVMFISSGVLAKTFHDRLRENVAVPEKLRLEAEAEASLEQAALDINLKAIFWNDAARTAREHGSATIVGNLLKQRAAIELRRFEVADNLRRFNVATAPPPRVVATTDDWGPVEKIDLSTYTDS